MKIYALADLHGSQYRLNRVLEMVKKHQPEAVVICGDITQFGPADVAKNFLDQIPGTVFAVPGNIDTEDAVKGIDQSHAINIHLKQQIYHGVVFVGVNGVNNRETALFYSDQNYVTMLEHVDILVSHVPPYGLQDMVFYGLHSGSKDLLSLVQKYKPRLVLCGHIHEDPGYTDLDQTVVVNCSMGKHGNGALITIGENIQVTML
jgi:Icc-related predicted phosphoesterase